MTMVNYIHKIYQNYLKQHKGPKNNSKIFNENLRLNKRVLKTMYGIEENAQLRKSLRVNDVIHITEIKCNTFYERCSQSSFACGISHIPRVVIVVIALRHKSPSRSHRPLT